ncbi:MAG TPA: hypothetical protein VNK92_01130, partial [Vicinamibacterales bacterium]|nr:hypothetical protein [Vicinamibacterales bacterium]
PPILQRLARRCLRKDLQGRLRDIADARLEIEEALAAESGAVAAPVAAPAPGTRRRPWLAAASAVAIAALAAVALYSGPWAPRESTSALRVTVPLAPGERIPPGPSPVVALSPDGRQLVYVAVRPPGRTRLFIRSLDRFEATPVPATEGATAPFFSPDGRWIGFHADGALQKVSLDGGVPFKVGDAASLSGAAWGPDDTIVFATAFPGDGLWRIPAGGGRPEPLTTPDAAREELRHIDPQFLPGGQTLLFTVVTRDGSVPALLSLRTQRWEHVTQARLEGGGARFLPSGHLLYAQAGGLVALPFDAETGTIAGTPIPLRERLATTATGGAQFDVSRSGTLVYVPARARGEARSLAIVDRDGRARHLGETSAAYAQPRFAADGRRLAVAIDSDAGTDIWVYDLQRGTRTRLTASGENAFPVWGPEPDQLTFYSARQVAWTLFRRNADGSAPAEALVTMSPPTRPAPGTPSMAQLLPGDLPVLSGANPQIPMSWSADGRRLAFIERKPSTERDIWVLERDTGTPVPFLVSPFDEWAPAFSPDGRFLAYVSDESGRAEVYVQPYPGPGGRWLISTDGGDEPVWSPDGRQIYYRHGTEIVSVGLQVTPVFSVGRGTVLFEAHDELTGEARNYDVSPDGRSFVVVRGDESPSMPQLHLVVGFVAELERAIRRGGEP